jgi:hypothetical protein
MIDLVRFGGLFLILLYKLKKAVGCQISEITYFWNTFNNKLHSEEKHFCVEQTKEQKNSCVVNQKKKKIYCQIGKDKYYKKNKNYNQICTYAKP